MCLLNISKVPGRLQQIGKLYMHVPCACWQTVCAECAVQTVFQMIKLFIPVDLCKLNMLVCMAIVPDRC